MRIRREWVQASGMWSGDQPTCKAATGQNTFLLNCDVYRAVYRTIRKKVTNQGGSVQDHWIRFKLALMDPDLDCIGNTDPEP